MDDLDTFIASRKKKSIIFSRNFDKGYEQFKIGVILKQARLEAGLTQEEVAHLLHTKKSAISRIENHAEEVRLSTLRNDAQAVGGYGKNSVPGGLHSMNEMSHETRLTRR